MMINNILTWYAIQFQNLEEIARPNAEAVETILKKCLEWFPPAEYKRIVDVGAGSGLITKVLAENYQDVHALDFSYESTTFRPEKNYREIKGDAHFLRNFFQTESIDGIIFNHSFEHLYAPILALAESFCVLREGGRLFINLPDPHGPVGGCSIHHPNVIQSMDYEELFNQLGFIVLITKYLEEPYLDYWWVLERRSPLTLSSKIRRILEQRMRD